MLQQNFKKLGVLGGMGPLATVTFMTKVIELTTAKSDQDHVPMMVSNVPQIPDRTAAIMQQGNDPFPKLLSCLRDLENGGSNLFVIPCNTAHFWYDRLKAEAKIDSISIIESVTENIHQRGFRKVGLLATDATVKAGLYPKALAAHGVDCIVPDSDIQQQVMQGIYAVKAGNLVEGRECLEAAFNALIECGAEAVIMGCTEIPVALDHLVIDKPQQCIDSLGILARACVDWYFTPQTWLRALSKPCLSPRQQKILYLN